MKPAEKKIWFPAKKYGWGWGFPCCWQGWVFFFVWLAALYGGIYYFFPPRLHPVLFSVYVGIFIAMFTVVCMLKGEKPGWRWGAK